MSVEKKVVSPKAVQAELEAIAARLSAGLAAAAAPLAGHKLIATPEVAATYSVAHAIGTALVGIIKLVAVLADAEREEG